MKRYLFPGLCVVALIVALHTITLAFAALGALRLEPVELIRADGQRHRLEVRIAETEEARGRGLMYVTSLDDFSGMLFDFRYSREVTMWMKNTPLSLDILFIDHKGFIVRIIAEARPFSTEIMPSGEPVRAALEIRGGRAAELGIQVGDRVQHRIFHKPPPAD